MNYTRGKVKIILGCIAVLAAFFAWAESSYAANFYFSPSSGNKNVGSSFPVSVMVSSTDQAFNAVSGTISFPTDKVTVTSLSRNGSEIDLWVEEPTFSNSRGTISFAGVVLNPGYQGSAANIITIHFRAQAAGNAFVTFSAGEILANDGQGTNILTQLGNANFALGYTEPVAPAPEVAPVSDRAPRVTSPTHPDESKWYPESTAEFRWNVPTGVTAVRTLIGQLPEVQPTVLYEPPIRSKTVEGLDDGVWYFHLQLRDSAGWSSTAHFRVQVDTTPPERFEVAVERKKKDDMTDPRVTFIFVAHDETSGIDHYEIRMGDHEPIIWKDDGSGRVEVVMRHHGSDDIILRAVDAAGNYLERTVRVEVMPLEPPILTDYPAALNVGEPLIVKGTTKYPNSRVSISVVRDGEEAKIHATDADGQGSFQLVFPERLEKGLYAMHVVVEDNRGARSKPSDAVTFRVDGLPVFQFGPFKISFQSMLMILLIILAILIMLTTYGGWRIMVWRKNVSEEAEEAEDSLEKAFDKLREKSEKLISSYDGRPSMSKREKKISDDVKEALEDAKSTVKKEIRDVRKLM